jgi:hypothetical protein
VRKQWEKPIDRTDPGPEPSGDNLSGIMMPSLRSMLFLANVVKGVARESIFGLVKGVARFVSTTAFEICNTLAVLGLVNYKFEGGELDLNNVINAILDETDALEYIPPELQDIVPWSIEDFQFHFDELVIEIPEFRIFANLFNAELSERFLGVPRICFS